VKGRESEMSNVRVSTPKCFHCNQYGEVVVDSDGFDKWMAGYLIQDAFPGLDLESREQLISGTHSECWDEMMKGDENE